MLKWTLCCDVGSRKLLASGSRDRLVHLFDPQDDYSPLATVDDHSSAINSIKFAMVGFWAGRYLVSLSVVQRSVTVRKKMVFNIFQTSEGLEMYTCAADKLIVIRRMANEVRTTNLSGNDFWGLNFHGQLVVWRLICFVSGVCVFKTSFLRLQTYSPSEVRFDRINQMTCQFGLNDLQLSADGHLLAACQDRQVRAFSLQGKLTKTFKATLSDDGILTKVRFLFNQGAKSSVSPQKLMYIWVILHLLLYNFEFQFQSTDSVFWQLGLLKINVHMGHIAFTSLQFWIPVSINRLCILTAGLAHMLHLQHLIQLQQN